MLQSNHRPNRDGFLGYLSAPRCGRVITVIGQVSSENVELAGDHRPRVTDFYLVLRGQEHPKLACREGRRRHCWALPRPQPTQRAVRNLKEMEEGNFGKHKHYKFSAEWAFEWAAFTKSWVRQSDNVQAHLSTITASTCYNLAPSGIFCAVILIKAVLCRRCRAAMRKRTINQQHKGSTQSLVLSYSKETIFAFCHGVKQERLHFGFQG